MKIELSQIKPSPNPIRTTWDEDALNELAQSIKEQGLIVPIKVRPIADEYEIVYGHRRAEACRRAGLEEIECIVEGMDDTENVIQALIENVIREDMTAVDKRDALNSIHDIHGKTWEEIGKMFGHSTKWAEVYSKITDKEAEIMKSEPGLISEKHVRVIRNEIKDEPTRLEILQKTANEELSTRQAQKVAEAIARAETQEERQAILSTPVENPMFDRIVRAKERAEIERKAEAAERHMGNTQEVKPFLDAIRIFEKAIKEVIESIEYHKFSPEAIQFTLNRMEKLSETIGDLTIKLMEAK